MFYQVEKENMEKEIVERELSSLLARTLSWEDEINLLAKLDD